MRGLGSGEELHRIVRVVDDIHTVRLDTASDPGEYPCRSPERDTDCCLPAGQNRRHSPTKIFGAQHLQGRLHPLPLHLACASAEASTRLLPVTPQGSILGSRLTITQAGLAPARTRGLARPHCPRFSLSPFLLLPKNVVCPRFSPRSGSTRPRTPGSIRAARQSATRIVACRRDKTVGTHQPKFSGLNTFRVGFTRYLCTSPAHQPKHRRACYQSRRKARYWARGSRLPRRDSHPLEHAALPGRTVPVSPLSP